MDGTARKPPSIAINLPKPVPGVGNTVIVGGMKMATVGVPIAIGMTTITTTTRPNLSSDSECRAATRHFWFLVRSGLIAAI